jgi:glucose-1-phosphatase
MTSGPTVLLFDLGGVLIENIGFQRFGQLLPREMELHQMKRGWLASKAVRRFESGVSSPANFASEVVAEWDIAITPESFLTEFSSWPQEASEDAVALIRDLKKHYRVACLSNSNELHWDRFLPLVQEFDVALSSHLTGRLKPDHEAFLGALEECGASAHDVFFFDDSLPNVEAATTAGIRSFHVEGLAELKLVLEEIRSQHGSQGPLA